jgi:hypothetical protein
MMDKIHEKKSTLTYGTRRRASSIFRTHCTPLLTQTPDTLTVDNGLHLQELTLILIMHCGFDLVDLGDQLELPVQSQDLPVGVVLQLDPLRQRCR